MIRGKLTLFQHLSTLLSDDTGKMTVTLITSVVQHLIISFLILGMWIDDDGGDGEHLSILLEIEPQRQLHSSRTLVPINLTRV